MADPTTPTGPSGTQQALAVLAGLAPGLIARATSGGANASVPPELSQAIQQQTARTQYQNPLFQAASNQAFMGLPTYARQGLSMPSSLPTVGLPPAGGGSGAGGKLGAGLAGAGLGALLSKLLGGGGAGSGAGGNLSKLADALKKLFHRPLGSKPINFNDPSWWTEFAGNEPSGLIGQFDPSGRLTPHVDTDWMVNLPEGSGQDPNLPYDPNWQDKLGGQNDVMAEYNAWLAQQSQGGGMGGGTGAGEKDGGFDNYDWEWY
jgi:hypothetical protein